MNKYIIESSEQEIHMLGDYVGVVWNMRWETKTLKDEEGTTYKREVLVRKGEPPYIAFCAIRKWDDGFHCEEGCSVEGGINYETGKKVLHELEKAVLYLGTLRA